MIINGVPGYKGITIARAHIYKNQTPATDPWPISPDQTDNELKKLAEAIEMTKTQITALREKALNDSGEKQAAIFEAHIALLDDPALITEIQELIESEYQTAGFAVETVVKRYINLFSALEDEYTRERMTDIKDVGSRILRNVLGLSQPGLSHLAEEVIVVTHDLTASDVMAADSKFVRGFAAGGGGKTSHAAILSQTREIPALFGLGQPIDNIEDGEMLILDSIKGILIRDADEKQLASYRKRQKVFIEQQAELRELAQLPAVTADGRQVAITANIGVAEDVDAVLESGADGIGLFRTEFLYIGRDSLPGEEEQYEAYRHVAEKMNRREVIIRTLDIGGDKAVEAFDHPLEDNPFLGWRGIRISLMRESVFKTQLRAILRASVFGNVLIMYPMISGVEEVRQANLVLVAAKTELRAEGIAFNENIKIGVMIEVPSAAITADIIAAEVDFFSIGTNDLCQYMLAVDRTNERIGNLYQPLHPAILRMVKHVIDVSHSHGKTTKMCGEMAGDPAATLILLGLGLDEFSMSAPSVPQIKKIIRTISYEKSKEIAQRALTLETPRQTSDYAADVLRDLGLGGIGG